jgi:predicted RNase H-like HicB family nuclease
MAAYVALIRKERRSDYGVDFPDFPGCVSAGRTLDEAVAMAHEALSGHVAMMVEEGEKLPAPSRLETILRDRHNKGAVPFLVSVSDAASKAVRVNVTIPEAVLQAIDARAKADGETRSGLLARGAMSLLGAQPAGSGRRRQVPTKARKLRRAS